MKVNLSNQTLSKLTSLLISLAEGEGNIEWSRQVLCDNYDYDSYKIFKVWDTSNKDKITDNDIVTYLNLKNIYISNQEAKNIIMAYDEDCDSELTYMEFINLIQSNNKVINYSSLCGTGTTGATGASSATPLSISFNLSFGFTKILEKELELTRRWNSLITDLKSYYDFDVNSLYNALKSWTCITYESISSFFSCTVLTPPSTINIRNIVKRLDFNRDGKVDLVEFKRFLNIDDTFANPIGTDNNCRIEKMKFIEYLKEVLESEGKIEGMKIDLALKSDFNIENWFRFFDYDNKNTITKTDWKDGWTRLEIYTSDIDISIWMNRFDLSRKGELFFSDLFDMFVPYERDYRAMVERRKPNNETNLFMWSTKIYMVTWIKAVIAYEVRFNELKKGYERLKKGMREIFSEIDCRNNGAFEVKDLEEYLKKNQLIRNGSTVNVKEKFLLFIRMDKKRHGRVDYCDWMDELVAV